jgi:23S rRNA pseudouridine2605 synthase
VRLNKFIASSGFCSRRAADSYISQGRVSVNGKTVSSLGVQIDPIKDKVSVEGKAIIAKRTNTVIAFYKPIGILSSMSEDPKGSLRDFVERMDSGRLFHIGRLDRESEGLILLTNDGDLAERIAHPRNEIEKEYVVSLDSAIKPEDLATLKRGIELEDGLFRADSARLLGETLVQLTIHQGKNRIIRRAFEHLGYEVERLLRIRVGHIKLGELKPGKWRHLSEVEKTF